MILYWFFFKFQLPYFRPGQKKGDLIMFTLITFLVKFAENLTTSLDKRNVDLITNAGKGGKTLNESGLFFLKNTIHDTQIQK